MLRFLAFSICSLTKNCNSRRNFIKKSTKLAYTSSYCPDGIREHRSPRRRLFAGFSLPFALEPLERHLIRFCNVCKFILPDVYSFCICSDTLFLPFSPPRSGALGVTGVVVSWVSRCHEARAESREGCREGAKPCLRFAKIWGFLAFLDKVCEGDQLPVSFVGRYKREWGPSREALCQLKSVMKVLLKRASDQIKT